MMKILQIIAAFFIGVIAHAQSLDDYVAIALKNNSNIKVNKAKYRLEKTKIDEVATYENTIFNAGIFALTPETRVGSQLFKIGVVQKLPWFGELEAKRNLQLEKSELKQYDIALSQKDIVFKVKKAYYQIYRQEAITGILKENKLILKTYENMALAALENNRATMSDVLRIRVQKNELHSKIFQNLNSLDILKQNFNNLLERDLNLPLNVKDSLNVLDILVGNTSVKQHPILLKLKNTKAVYQAEEKVIQKSEKPKISVGLDYILVNKRTDSNPLQNGKDIVMPKVSLSIPVFNKKKYQSKHQQVKIKEALLFDDIQANETNLQIALNQAKLDLDNAILTVVAAQKNKNEIQRAINVDLKAYETGILDYDKILRLQLQKIRFQLKEIEATEKAYIAKSKIDYLTK